MNGKGVLDLFSGSRGLARALARHLNTWVLTYDILHGPGQDLLAEETQAEVQNLVAAGCFRVVTAGPVCSSFSRAVRPPVRSRSEPRGFASLTCNMACKVAEGNLFSQWLASVIQDCLDLSILVLVENPWMSYLWDQPEWQEIRRCKQVGFFTTDFCMWGAPWRKRTRFLTNCSLAGEKLFCQCGAARPHIQLKGYSSEHRKPWTKVAEAYPARLCNALALFLEDDLRPAERRQRLDI